MNQITISEVQGIHDASQLPVVARLANAFAMAMHKGAAHVADAARFPVTYGSGSVEEIVARLVLQLPAKQQRVVVGRALALTERPIASSMSAASLIDPTSLLRDLALLDLTATEPIMDQVTRLFHADSAPGLSLHPDQASAAGIHHPTARRLPMLQLRIRGTKCLSETAQTIAADEMHVSGITLDADGQAGVVADLKLGDFSRSEDFAYFPSLVVAKFDLDRAPCGHVEWPRSYFVMLLLTEIRHSGHSLFAEAARRLLDVIQLRVREILSKANEPSAPGCAAGETEPSRGPLIAEVLGDVMTQAFASLAALFNNKLFSVVTLRIDVPSHAAAQANPNFSELMTFDSKGFEGAYRIFYDWHLGEEQTAWSDWMQLDGELASAPAVVSWGKHRIDVFVRGNDDQMLQKIWRDAHGWGKWIPLGGGLGSAPAAVSWGEDRIDCFCRTKDNHLGHTFWNGSTWSPWEDLGGDITSAPAAAAWGPARIDVFARGANNQLLHRSFTAPGGWAAWQDLGGNLLDAPAVVSPSLGVLHVYIHGQPSATWSEPQGESRHGISYRFRDGEKWGDWGYLGGSLASAPAVCSSDLGREDVFARGMDGQLYHKGYSGRSGWGEWECLGGQLSDAPAVVTSWRSTTIDCFIKGTDNHLWQRWVWGIPLG
ncbi:MAG: hypothetical protein JNJ46_22520 [Myxococcales bacterium]|nr:hypothetical protein [Myxococcales bacterium]